MIVKTRVGEINVPEYVQVGARTKFWALALQDLIRVEEHCGVLAAALNEAYEQGRVVGFLQGSDKRMSEVIDVEFEVLGEETKQEERSTVETDPKELHHPGEPQGVQEVAEELAFEALGGGEPSEGGARAGLPQADGDCSGTGGEEPCGPECGQSAAEGGSRRFPEQAFTD